MIGSKIDLAPDLIPRAILRDSDRLVNEIPVLNFYATKRTSEWIRTDDGDVKDVKYI